VRKKEKSQGVKTSSVLITGELDSLMHFALAAFFVNQQLSSTFMTGESQFPCDEYTEESQLLQGGEYTKKF
jgi:hypothetical protein